MSSEVFNKLDPARLPSPCFVIDEVTLEHNLQLLNQLQQDAGVRILLALKAFSMFRVAPLVMKYLDGTCASGLWEARLGRQEFGGEVHTFSTAFDARDINEVFELSDHVVFNSPGQWHRFRNQALQAQQLRPQLEFGLRINPEHREAETDLYDPCAPASRLGVRVSNLEAMDLSGITGFHLHTLCDQLYAPLERTLDVVEAKFGDLLESAEWLNLGGGHLLTHADYDRQSLVERLGHLRDRYSLQLYLEPGTAVALNTGVLVTEVLDTPNSGVQQAILNCSPTCHSPDVLEAPYRPGVIGAGEAGSRAHTYQLGGTSCLAGDVFGVYSFDQPLQIGERLMIEDQAYYTMVKMSTFNGLKLPAIVLWNSDTGEIEVVREFGYQDFRQRLS